jgi:sugar phosphate isomerase/epimerase
MRGAWVMGKDLQIGIQTNGIKHTHADPMPDIDTRFRMAKETGAFDYVDKTPAPEEVDEFIAAREKYGLPIRAGGWFYTLGRDEPLLVENLKLSGQLGSIAHNVQVTARDVDGKLVTDEEVVDFYEMAVAEGDKYGVHPCLEVHVNMWSEDFRRVEVVGRMAEDRGLPFRMTLDHSHVIFKIDNPKEQDVFDIRGDVEA